jgi:Anti-sigma-K factor rskA
MTTPISEKNQMLLAAGYVLGNLDALEDREFESALSTNPDLWAEVYALQHAFNNVPQGLPQVDPPSALKAKIIESFSASSSTSIKAVHLSQLTVTEAIPTPRKKFAWGKVVAGMGILIGGLLSFDNFNLRQELQLAQQVNQQELASILSQPKSRLLSLSDREDRVVGKVLFTPGNWQQVIVSAKNLPPLPVDRVYRMWLELANGQVIPCGEFKTSHRGSIFVKLNAKQKPPAGVKAKGVFVTIDRTIDPLEPTGPKVIQGTI